MSKHQEILPRIVDLIRQVDPACGIVLFGSVAAGRERPESDLDLLVVGHQYKEIRFADFRVVHEENGMGLVRGHIEGITVDLACWPAGLLARSMTATPYMFYPFSLGKILHDPDGLARQHVQTARDYFHANRDIADAWAEQLAKFRRHQLDRSYELEFPEWGDFVKHLGSTIGQRRTNNEKHPGQG